MVVLVADVEEPNPVSSPVLYCSRSGVHVGPSGTAEVATDQHVPTPAPSPTQTPMPEESIAAGEGHAVLQLKRINAYFKEAIGRPLHLWTDRHRQQQSERALHRGTKLIDSILDVVRKEAQGCYCLQGFQLRSNLPHPPSKSTPKHTPK